MTIYCTKCGEETGVLGSNPCSSCRRKEYQPGKTPMEKTPEKEAEVLRRLEEFWQKSGLETFSLSIGEIERIRAEVYKPEPREFYRLEESNGRLSDNCYERPYSHLGEGTWRKFREVTDT